MQLNNALLHGSTALVGPENDSWASKAAAERLKRSANFGLKLRQLVENGDLCRNCEDMIAAL